MFYFSYYLEQCFIWLNRQKINKEVDLSQAIEIFISGITGVFFGMALLYISIKIMELVASRWITEEKEKKDA